MEWRGTKLNSEGSRLCFFLSWVPYYTHTLSLVLLMLLLCRNSALYRVPFFSITDVILMQQSFSLISWESSFEDVIINVKGFFFNGEESVENAVHIVEYMNSMPACRLQVNA